jgi:hypothetical protein
MKQTYKEYRKEVEAEQEGMSSKEVIEHLKAQKDMNGQPLYSHIFDINHLPQQTHHWIDRGAKLTCEGASHQYHESWKKS